MILARPCLEPASFSSSGVVSSSISPDVTVYPPVDPLSHPPLLVQPGRQQ